jgi:hypothetical protein
MLFFSPKGGWDPLNFDPVRPMRLVYYIRWLRIAMMHTKLVRMKWGMFWNILHASGVDQGQVGEPGVLHQVHWVV